MNREYYEIMIDGKVIDTTRLGGIAFLKLQSALLLSKNSKLVKRFDNEDDKVLHAPTVYNTENGSWDELK